MDNYITKAKQILHAVKYEYDVADVDAKKLAENMESLAKRGLCKFNDRLLDVKSNVNVLGATITEHNFAVMLISILDPTTTIEYEPDGFNSPPDFKFEIEGVTCCIQVKRLSMLKRENIQRNLIKRIAKNAKQVEVGKYFTCMLADGFNEACLDALMDFIRENAKHAPEGKAFVFKGACGEMAEIKFWLPSEKTLSELTFCCAGDLDSVDITGLDVNQMRESFTKAAKPFKKNTNDQNINLIAVEADAKDDIDICDALFGSEYEWAAGDKESWARKSDGLFKVADFSKRVSGVIVMKRMEKRVERIADLSPEDVVRQLSPQEKAISAELTPCEIKQALEWTSPGLFTDYSRILYVNNKQTHLLKSIVRHFGFNKIVCHEMRPLF